MRTKQLSVLAAVLLSAALAVTGCFVGDDSDDPTLDETGQALGSASKVTNYYDSAAKTHRVGYCVGPSICQGGSTVCYGTHPTPYYDYDLIWC